MRFIKDQKGAMAVMTIVAMIPVIGAIGLGGEAAGWMYARSQAQTAADSAAISGGLLVACQNAGNCSDTATVAQRGAELAAQNGFVDGGAPAPNMAQNVAVTQLGSWGGNDGTFVQSQVGLQMPTYLARILGIRSVNIQTQATAQVKTPQFPPCVFALTGSVTASSSIGAPNCAVVSNGTTNTALNLSGTVTAGAISTSGGCAGSCSGVATYTSPAINPYLPLDALAISLSNCSGGFQSTGTCINTNTTITSGTTINMTGGTAFIGGQLTVRSGAAITGTGLLVLLPSASILVQNGGNITLTGGTTSAPAALSSEAGLLANMALYSRSATNPLVLGNGNNLKGAVYAPNNIVDFKGDARDGNTCGQLVAASIVVNGAASFDNSGCSASVRPTGQYVQLVPQ